MYDLITFRKTAFSEHSQPSCEALSENHTFISVMINEIDLLTTAP